MLSRNQARVIPTHVEQTTQTFSWHRHDATHSHARGTDFLTSPVSPAWLDSLPHTRDRLYLKPSIPRRSRLIPTCAGQTEIRKGTEQPTPTHSHSRGTDKTQPKFGVVEPDSFPLAWDNHKCAAVNFKNQLDSFPPMWDAS